MALQLVKDTVEELKKAHIEPEDVAHAIESFLQDGLKGNRAVADNLWSVVLAAVRAFPIHLSPSVEKAQAAVEACPQLDLVKTWLVQAAADGSLVILLQKLRSQPQILTAYDSQAPLRNAATVQQLIDLLQELKALIPITPYDRLLQLQALQRPAAAHEPVHIQTEQDLPHHSHHTSSSGSSASPQQEQQSSGQPPGQCQPDGLQSLSKASTTASSSSSSSLGTQEPAGEGAFASAKLAAAKRIDRKLLGAFSRKASSSSSSSSAAVSTTAATGKDADRSDHSTCVLPGNNCPEVLIVKVQLQVVKGTSDQQHPVRLHLEVGTSTGSSRCSPSGPSSKGASSSSRLLGAGAGAVKGLLQGLHQSATSGLQQSAAAGQDISGAVAAAGGAVAAAIGQPFAAVKGFAAAATGRAGGKKVTGSGRASPTKGHASAGSGDAAADAAVSTSDRTSMQLPKFFKHKQSGPAAAAHSSGSSTLVASPASTEGRQLTFSEQLVKLHLEVSGDAAAELPVRCAIRAVTLSSRASSSTAGVGGWGAKGLMNKFSSMGRSSKEANRHSKLQQQEQEQQDGGAGDGAAGGSAEAGEGDVLEGDMWSVMTRLRNNSMTQAAGAAEDEGVAVAADDTAAAQQLHEQGQQLYEQLLDTCSQVAADAAATRGCIGDESPQLLQLVELLKDLFNHGLKQSSSSSGSSSADAGGKAAAAFSGWLSSRSLTAFGVLQALQHGSKQHPRLMLGADSISNMQAARHASPAAMLVLWVRSSLNEQLLGVRLSTLLANPTALAQYYWPQALLLQLQEMQNFQQQFAQLMRCKFALLVEAPAVVGAATTAGSGRSSSSSSASKGVVMDPRRLLGGFSKSFSTLRAGSSSSTAAAAPAAVTADSSTALAADPAAGGSSSSSSAIPTFLWSALGHSSISSTAAAAGSEAAPEAGLVGSGSSMLKRGQRRLANILEVRVPPPDSAAVLSSENSCALSPVSTPGDAAYAEWWSPNSSFQDMQGAAAAAASGQDVSFGGDAVLPDHLQKDDPDAQCSPGGLRSSSSAESLGSKAAAAAAGSSEESRAADLHGSAVGSEAAKKLEQELTAAMAAPLQVLRERSRRTGSSSSSSGGGAAGSAVDSGSDSKSTELHRSSSSGWEAAVASARARSKGRVGTSVGFTSSQLLPGGNLRPPDAHWPVAGAGCTGSSSGPTGGAGAEDTNVYSQAAAVRGESRRVRHMHKRSSSLNDLPELAALLDSGVIQL